MRPGRSMKNGSELRPAKTRRPSPLAPCSSSTRKRVCSPDGVTQPAVLHRRHASAVLLGRLEVAGEHQLLVLAGEGEGRRRPAAGDGDRPQPEAADDRVREGRSRAWPVAARSARARGGPAAQGWGTRRNR